MKDTIKSLRAQVRALQRELHDLKYPKDREIIAECRAQDPWIALAAEGNICEEAILRLLFEIYPMGMIKAQLARRIGYSATAGCFQHAMQRLIETGRITSGPIHALMPQVAR